MSEKEKPDWWPRDPFPEDIFPMARERYQEIVPDPDIRTALSGCLGRMFWEAASDTIFDAFRVAREAEVSVSEDRIEKILAILHNLESGLAMPFGGRGIRYTDFETMVEVMRHTQRGLKKLIEDIEKEMPCGDP